MNFKAARLLVLLLVAMSAVAQSVPPLRFAPSAKYPVGSKVTRIATGDLNGDGKPDIVVCDQNNHNIYVLLNKGDGTLLAPVPYSLGNLGNAGPNSIVIADFNKDNKLDVAVATNSNGNVLVFLGNGDGTLQSPLTSATNLSPTSLKIGDVNKDGKLDLLVGGNGGAAILLGKGDGTFDISTATLPLDNGIISMPVLASADVNGDGLPDIIGGVISGVGQHAGLSVYLANPDGSFQNPVTYQSNFAQVSSMLLVDVNGDSKLDAVVASPGGGVNLVFLGKGDGTFQPPLFWYAGSMAQGLATADFNGDGKPDIANANANSLAPPSFPPVDGFGATVTAGAGDGNQDNPTQIQIEVGATGTDIVTADFNGDGLPDLATVDLDHVSIFLNGSSMNVTASASPSPVPPAQAYTLNATVTSASGSGPVPTGSVTFIQGGGSLELGHVLGTATLDGSGMASLSVAAGVAAGPIFIQTEYSGDSTHIGSNALPFVVTFGFASQTTVVPSLTTAAPGTSISFVANVTATHAPPTGRVNFVEGHTSLGLVTLVNGSATLTTSTLATGSHTIRALYVPDAAATAAQLLSSAASVTVQIGNSSTITLAITGGATAGSTATLTATVAGASGTPTGTVTFKDGTTVLGTSNLTNGVATFTSSTIPAGSHSITASYSGDINYLVSASASAALTISPDFTVGVSPTTTTMMAGSTGTATLTVTPQAGGFSSAVQLTCSGAPALSTCTIAPGSVTPGNAAATATVTITTTATTSSLINTNPNSRMYFAFSLPAFGFGFVFAGFKLSKKRRIALIAFVTLLLVFCWTGCGGDSKVSINPKPGTTPGTYTLTLTATSGTTVHSTTATLVVQ